jgi:hypothetical protein
MPPLTGLEKKLGRSFPALTSWARSMPPSGLAAGLMVENSEARCPLTLEQLVKGTTDENVYDEIPTEPA